MEIKTAFREATLSFKDEKELTEYLQDLKASQCSYWLLNKSPSEEGIEVLIRTQINKALPVKRQKLPYEVARKEYENAPVLAEIEGTKARAKALCYRLDRYGSRVKADELAELIEDLHFLEKKVKYPFLERREGKTSGWYKKRRKALEKRSSSRQKGE